METLYRGESNLGWKGAFRGAARMLTSNPKHLIQLSGALVLLPYAILSAVTYRQEVLSSAVAWDLISGRLADDFYKAYAAAMADPAAADQLVDIAHRMEPASIKQAWPSILCSLFIFFVSVPALTVSLCKAYLNINAGAVPRGQFLQSLKASLAVARKAWKSLFLTALCTVLAWLAFALVASIVCAIILVLVTNARTRPEWPNNVVLVEGIATLVAGMCLATVWSLADGVAVLEGRSGYGALARSAHLVAGRSPLSSTRSWGNAGAALCLVVFFSVAGVALTRLLAAAKDIPTSASPIHFAVAVAVVTIRSSVILTSVLATVLLYLSCRAHHQESLENLVASLTSRHDIPYVVLSSIKVAPHDKSPRLNSEANSEAF